MNPVHAAEAARDAIQNVDAGMMTIHRLEESKEE
mgnify:CR=1 FL=1